MTQSSSRSFPVTILARAVAAAVLVGALGACSERSGRGGRGGMGGPTPVIVGRAERKAVPLVIDAVGTVEPIQSATIRAQVTGTLLKIDIREGQDVAAGDLLFEIDPRPYENALKSALADQQKISVQLQNARDQLERYRGLSVGAMISQDQLQQVRDNARALEAQAASAEAAVATAKLQLSYCSLRAPIAGRTGNLNVHQGDMIRTSDATALVTINQLSPIYVTFGVPQQHLAAVNHYRAAGTLKVSAVPGLHDDPVDHGELSFVDNAVDPSTGTIKLKATFSNADSRLWPGQFANVTLTLATPTVLTIPASAVQADQAGQHVYVVKEDRTAELRPLQIERSNDEVAVVTKGLTEGEIVVIDGQLRVTPGEEVQIKSPDVLTNPDAALTDDAPPHGAKKGSARKQGS